ncbi:MAG TPA: ABC transporter substrate-binding protein [Candidatus Eisenbacteria bacterium]|nr:ABC transporter substrate-binding protein [Candidatus Eisenbacteria bacterium]
MRPSRLALIVSALLAAAACSGSSTTGSSAPRTSTKSTIVVGVTQEPTTLDVTAQATAAIAEDLRDNVYEGLVRTDPTGKVVPQLAKSWDISSDGRVFTFHLVTARFHDGAAFTAEDVKFSYDRARDTATVPANPHADYWAPVQSVDVVDDHTVKVTLKQFSDGFLFHMGQGSGSIVPKSTRLATTSPPATGLATNPVGTGPFKFVSWNRGDSLTLVRNDDYWGPRAPLQKVVFKYITDPNAMNNALLAGDIDVVSGVTGPEQLGSFASNAAFKVLEGRPTGKIMVAMNNAAGPTKDVRVRQAISYAIDRKAFIDGIEQGHAVPIGSHAVPNDSEPYYTDLTGVYKQDKQKARQLLADAGYAGGLTLRISLIPFAYARRGGDILASQLQDVGIKLQVQNVEFPLWLDQVFTRHNYDLTIINHVEPRDIGNYGNPRYYWGYDSAQVAALLKQADAEQDARKRNDLYGQVERQLTNDAVNAWLMSPNSLAVIKSTLHGYPQSRVAASIYLGAAYFS